MKHADYLNQEREGIFDKPEFRFDSKGRVVIPFPGKDNLTLSVTPGSKIISQSTSTYTNKPMTDPASLRTGRLYAETVIQIGNSIYLDALNECITVGQDGATQWIMDSEYLRGIDKDDTIFGFFLQDTKIKEGEFSKGDVLIGNYPSSYIRYDNSNRRLLIVGDLAMAGDIASTNFVTLVSGYKLEYITGNAEFSNVVVRGTSTIGGTLATSIGTAINNSSNLVTDIINARLDSSAKTILAPFTFGVSGAIQIGTYSAGVSGDVKISPSGILGRNSANATTFSIDATTGAATFAGSLSAASGTLGAITIGTNAWHVDSSGNMWWGNFASYADATIKVASTGSVNFTTGTFSGNISGATITGSTLSTGTTGNNVQITDGRIVQRTGTNQVIYTDIGSNGGSIGWGDVDGNTCFYIEVEAAGAAHDIGFRGQATNSGDWLFQCNDDIMLVGGSGHDFSPSTDNASTLGWSSNRWADLRSTLINGADYGFEHNWYLTEGYKVGIEEPGIAILNEKNDLIMFIGEQSLYTKQTKNINTLPYVKTTLKQRVNMDIKANERHVPEDKEIFDIPKISDASIGGSVYKEKKIIIKKNNIRHKNNKLI